MWQDSSRRCFKISVVFLSSNTYSFNTIFSRCQVEEVMIARRGEWESYYFCCDVARGASDTFVMYPDSFMVQQRPLYCVSSLSASYSNHNLTTTLPQLGWENGSRSIAYDATRGEIRARGGHWFAFSHRLGASLLFSQLKPKTNTFNLLDFMWAPRSVFITTRI